MAIDTITGEGIRSLQRALNYAVRYSEANYIPITGVMDPNTSTAIKEFQGVFGQPETGTITPEEITMLETEMVRKNIKNY